MRRVGEVRKGVAVDGDDERVRNKARRERVFFFFFFFFLKANIFSIAKVEPVQFQLISHDVMLL